MCTPILRAFQLVVFALLLVPTPTTLPAQETFFFDDSIQEIDVPESQEEKICDRLDDEIESLRDALRTTQNKLRQRVLERETAAEKLLTPEQRKTLNEQRFAETQKSAENNAEFMGEFGKLLVQLAGAGDLNIFEGLPRATDDELAKIKNDNQTIQIDGWSFYDQPLQTLPSTVEKLRSTLIDYRLFEPYSGAKFCGGFHPDFCVQWEAGSKRHNILICLTCHESVYIASDGKTTFDYNDAAWKSFIQIAVSTFTKNKEVVEKLNQIINGTPHAGGMF